MYKLDNQRGLPVKHMLMCAQSNLTFCSPVDYSPPGSSVCGVFQTRNTGTGGHFLLWGASQPRDQTYISCISCIDRQILYLCTTWEVLLIMYSICTVFILSCVRLFATPLIV